MKYIFELNKQCSPYVYIPDYIHEGYMLDGKGSKSSLKLLDFKDTKQDYLF